MIDWNQVTQVHIVSDNLIQLKVIEVTAHFVSSKTTTFSLFKRLSHFSIHCGETFANNIQASC